MQQAVVRSHQRYHIEYGPRLSNHLMHGLITLYLLGGIDKHCIIFLFLFLMVSMPPASEKRIQEWADEYSDHEVIGYQLEPPNETDLGVTITMNNFIDYLGKRK